MPRAKKPEAIRYSLHARYDLAKKVVVLNEADAEYVIYDNIKQQPVPMRRGERHYLRAAQARMAELECGWKPGRR